VLEQDEAEIDCGLETLRAIYRRTIFPQMKAAGSAQPDDLVHRDSPGCFRCRDDEPVDEGGDAIFTDCTRCHAILARGGEAIADSTGIDEGRPFVRPEDSETFEELTLRTDCHTGGAGLYE